MPSKAAMVCLACYSKGSALSALNALLGGLETALFDFRMASE